MTTETIRRPRGARKQFPDLEQITLQVTADHRRRLEDYAAREQVSQAEAMRRAIDMLEPPRR
jgi:hypothetical protein